MLRANLLAMSFLVLGCSILIAQDDEKLKSGPKVGAFMPAPFECVNFNGPAKGRPHCLVCKFALLPSVLIFAKEPAEGKEKDFDDLLQKLEETAAEFQDRDFSVGVVFLSPHARDSTNNAEAKEAKEIIQEAIDRKELHARLSERGKKYKHVIVASYQAEGPKKYDISPKAELTILFYERLKIMENWAYAPGALEGKDVEMIVKKVRDGLPLKKKMVEK
ncbi:MAG: hypothetical protein EXR98_11650 [Gemmataceae bacterium]|nr:hypothetical protein [Gemmataceae bacterium]